MNTGRMKRLIEMDAPESIIVNEARILLRAGMKAKNDWQLVGKLLARCVRVAFSAARLNARLWCLRSVYGMTEDEAVDQICKEREPRC